MKKTDINWDFFNNIPLIPIGLNEMGVLDILGIDYNEKNKVFLCQQHNDHTPSAAVLGDNNERYICRSCGASGTALNLVSTVLGISIRDAALFLDEYYPGGIEKREEIIKVPVITKQQLICIGLKYNPLTPIYYREKGNQEKYIIDTLIATNMIMGKIKEYESRNNSYIANIFKNFPYLTEEDKIYMKAKVMKDMKWAKNLMEEIRDYDRKVAEQLNAMEYENDKDEPTR